MFKMKTSGNGISRRLVGIMVVLIVVVASVGAVFAATQTPTAPIDAAALEARQALCLETQKTALDERVASGALTQEAADALYAQVEERVEACDGTATGVGTMQRNGQNGNAGTGAGMAAGTGAGTGAAYRRGATNSARGGNAGVCIVTPAA